MTTPIADPNPAADAFTSRREFLSQFEPLRPELYRYCRYLTRSPWDAEDLTQDTLTRAFTALTSTTEPPENPRAWLFRIASNSWLKLVSRDRTLSAQDAELGVELRRASREAAGTLLATLAPQERAAVVLKEAFDFSLEEVATALDTSVGAVKAALHRGRGKLAAPEQSEPRVVTPAVLTRFCAAFNAGDLAALTALLLEDAVVETPGVGLERGAAAARAGTFRGTLQGCVQSDALLGLVGPPRSEIREHRGEALLLWWWGDEVRSVVRVEVRGERIARMRNYFHSPELLLEVCAELGVPARSNGYLPMVGGHP